MNPADNRVRLDRWTLAAASVVACLIALHFRGFFPRFATHLIGDHGDVLLQHLHCSWQWLALSEGRFGEFLTLPTFYPYSTGFAFGETLIGVTVPFAPLFALTGSTPAAFNAALVAAYVGLGVAIFLWVRELFDAPAAGLLAAVLIVFVPWRLQLLTNLNNMTVHFALLGAWLLTCWTRTPRMRTLLAAALCFHVQLITSAQVAVVAVYFTLIWFAVVWATRGFALDRQRAGQLGIAVLLFSLMAWPWWAFFSEAFEASRGLPRTREMVGFASDFVGMARQFGAIGPLGALAVAGAVAMLAVPRRLPPGAGAHVLGVFCAAAILTLLARGPYLDAGSEQVNPAYYLTRALPFLSAYRAPVRLAAFTPIALAVFAGGGFALLIASLRARVPRSHPAWYSVPLLAIAFWPALDPAMSAPIEQRPADLALARALAELPDDAVILPLPLDLKPSGAAIDEWVRIHRRSQVGGFASLIPPVFRSARNSLGQWPSSGHHVVRALGVTHVVVPETWSLNGQHTRVARAGGRVILSVLASDEVARPAVAPTPDSAQSDRVPDSAALGRWLTLAVGERMPRFYPQGHQRLPAIWHGADGRETRVEAFAMFPGVVSPTEPIRVHVPTPTSLGAGMSRLEISSGPFRVSAEVQLETRPTTADQQPRRVAVGLAENSRVPEQVRAGRGFALDVVLGADDGPILLASSRVDLPFRQGETQVLARYRSTGGSQTQGTPGLSSDLVPGADHHQRWQLGAPSQPGIYDLDVSLFALGSTGPPSAWIPLISGLRVVDE